MTRDQMKVLIERLYLIWNTGDFSSIPDVYATDLVVHWSRAAAAPESHGHEGVEAVIRETRAVFSDWNKNVVDIVIEADRMQPAPWMAASGQKQTRERQDPLPTKPCNFGAHPS